MTKKTDEEILELFHVASFNYFGKFLKGYRATEAPLLAEIEQLKSKLEQIGKLPTRNHVFGHNCIFKSDLDKILESK